MKKIIMLSALLIACTPNKYDGGIVIENTIREFKIISINPPKHFSVDLVDVKSMDIYKNQGKSKHCNNHTKFDTGDLIKIKRKVIKYKDGSTAHELVGVNHAI